MPDFVYKNEDYLSEVNDFGDEYHQPDEEKIVINDDDLFAAVKGLKRRYRDIDEYFDAMNVFNTYIDNLVEIYGGKKRFKLAIQLGLVKEYIPVVPVLRKTKANKPYIEKNLPRVDKERFDTSIYESPKVDPKRVVKITFGLKDRKSKVFSGFTSDLNREQIVQNIETIEKWYQNKTKHPTKLSKKAQKRRIMRSRFLKEDYVPFEQRLDEYWEKVDMGPSTADKDTIINYKGVCLNEVEAEEIEARDALRAIGLKIGVKMLSKKSRKIVKKSKEKKKKESKKKKNNSKLKRKYLDSFGVGEHETFSDFERSVQSFVASEIRGGK